MTDFTAFPIANVTIPSLPDLGGVTDATMLVGERAGTGRFAATGLRDYVMTTVGAGYLPLAGGTLTGNLTVQDTVAFSSGMWLHSDADFSYWLMDGSAAYKLIYNRHNGFLEYQRSDGAEIWSVDGVGNCNVANQLTVGGNGVQYKSIPGGHANYHAFDWTGTTLNAWVDGGNQGPIAIGSFLPTSGGTLTGNLTVQDTVAFSSGMWLHSDADFSYWLMDGSAAYKLIYNRHNGFLEYQRSDGAEIWSVDGAGNCNVANQLTVGGNGVQYKSIPGGHANYHAFDWTGTTLNAWVDGGNQGPIAIGSFLPTSGGAITGGVTVGGTISADGVIGSALDVVAGRDLYARGGHIYFGAGDQAQLTTASTGVTLRFSADGWALFWNSANGTLGYINNSSLALFTLDGSGNGTFLGTVHGTNVTLLESKVELLQARIAGLEGDLAKLTARIADLEGNIASRVMALEAQMAARTSD